METNTVRRSLLKNIYLDKLSTVRLECLEIDSREENDTEKIEQGKQLKKRTHIYKLDCERKYRLITSVVKMAITGLMVQVLFL